MLARVATLVLVAAIALTSGCGGSGPEETVRDYLTAIVDQDGEAACEDLSDDLRADIEQSPAAQASGRTCAEVTALAAGLNPDVTAEDIDELQIDVSEDGDQATATFENPFAGREETIDLERVDDDWKISTLETRPSG